MIRLHTHTHTHTIYEHRIIVKFDTIFVRNVKIDRCKNLVKEDEFL